MDGQVDVTHDGALDPNKRFIVLLFTSTASSMANSNTARRRLRSSWTRGEPIATPVFTHLLINDATLRCTPFNMKIP